MANLYNLCRKDGTVVEYSITASDIAKRIGCDRQDIYSSASYGLLIKKEYYVEITDRPLSWENDILMCHGNSEDLVKTVFGEFGVRNIETGSIVDKVVGWHYEIIPTDTISRCEPFCYSMPLTKDYIDRCEMEVVGSIFDNPELVQGSL